MQGLGYVRSFVELLLFLKTFCLFPSGLFILEGHLKTFYKYRSNTLKKKNIRIRRIYRV